MWIFPKPKVSEGGYMQKVVPCIFACALLAGCGDTVLAEHVTLANWYCEGHNGLAHMETAHWFPFDNVEDYRSIMVICSDGSRVTMREIKKTKHA